MRMNTELEAAFNEQIATEFFSSYSYMQMAAYCEAVHLFGFSRWLRMQAEEEWGHALKFYQYVLDRGSSVLLPSIPAPRSDYGGILAVFEEALGQEQSVTQKIHALYRMSTEREDFMSLPLLQWFIAEQVEEESSVEAIVHRLRMAGDSPSALLMLDREQGTRGPGQNGK